MKGLAVLVAVSMAFVPGASAREELTENARIRFQAAARSSPEEVEDSQGRPERRALLSSDTAGLLDDALDAKGSVSVKSKANTYQVHTSVSSTISTPCIMFEVLQERHKLLFRMI